MDNRKDASTTGAKAAPANTQRTGPATGGQRGNDLPSEGRTQKDGRQIEGATGTPNKRSAPGQQDPRDLKERKDDRQTSTQTSTQTSGFPSSQSKPQPSKQSPASDTSEEPTGEERQTADVD